MSKQLNNEKKQDKKQEKKEKANALSQRDAQAAKKAKEEKKAKEKKKQRIAFLKKTLIAFAIVSVIGTAFVMYITSSTETTQYPEPTANFFIEDYSQVFTEETEQFIMKQAVALQDATKAQIVVVAAPNTQADSLEDFSYNLAKNWGIGDADLDNGVLILFTTEDSEPHVRMEVGKGLEGCLNDSKAGRILDDWAVDAKDNGRWNEAAINTWVETAKVVYDEYGLEAPNDLVTVESGSISEEVSGRTMADDTFPEVLVEKSDAPLLTNIASSFCVFWFFALLPFLFICLMLFSNSSGGKNGSHKYSGYYGDGYSGGGGGGFSGGGGDFGGGGASR